MLDVTSVEVLVDGSDCVLNVGVTENLVLNFIQQIFEVRGRVILGCASVVGVLLWLLFVGIAITSATFALTLTAVIVRLSIVG